MVVVFFLLGLAVAFWRQVLALTAIFIVGSLLWRGGEYMWRMVAPERVYIKHIEVVRDGDRQYLDFIVANDHQDRLVRNVRFRCDGSDTMISPVVIWPKREAAGRSYVRNTGWDDNYRFAYTPIDTKKCRVTYSVLRMESDHV